MHQGLGRQRPDPPETYTPTGRADAHQQSDGTSPPAPCFKLPRMSFRGTITPLLPNPKLSRVLDSSSFFTPHVQPIPKSHSFCLPHCAEPRPLSPSRASSAALTSYLDYDKRQPTVSPICHLPSFQFMPWVTALRRKRILLSLENMPWTHAALGSALAGPVRCQPPIAPSSLQFLRLSRCHAFF